MVFIPSSLTLLPKRGEGNLAHQNHQKSPSPVKGEGSGVRAKMQPYLFYRLIVNLSPYRLTREQVPAYRLKTNSYILNPSPVGLTHLHAIGTIAKTLTRTSTL